MRSGLLTFAFLSSLCAGCGPIGAMIYYLHPPQTVDPEFVLKGKVAIMIEAARANEENPLFAQALYDKFVENVQAAERSDEAPLEFIPFDQVLRLRQKHEDFRKWGVQRIGRELHADQVVYIRILRLQFEESPGNPVIDPRVALTVVVVGVDAPADKPRLWPETVEGREVTASRQTRDIADARAIDDEATRLAKDVANIIARYFHEYDPEDKLVKEK